MSHSLVILESPYGSPDPAGVAANVKYLQRCIRHSVLTCGESPYASHQMLTAALDDCSPEEREVGIKAGFAWRTVAAKTVVYLDRGLSRGMVFGIQDALKVGCPIELRSFAPVTHEVSSRLEVLGLPITQIVEWPEDLNPTPQEQRIVTGVVYEPDVVTSTG